jgi:hypothetical protein
MSSLRAVKYRRLALASGDQTNKDLLLKIADESDRGMLCTAEWILRRRSSVHNEAPKAADGMAEYELNPWDKPGG